MPTGQYSAADVAPTGQYRIDDVASPAEAPSSKGGLILTAAGEGAPFMARAATMFAQSPTAAKVGGAVARTGTTLAGVAHGITTGNLSEVFGAPIAGWYAGKGGYWLTKGAQSGAKPLAALLEKAAPYAQSLSTLGAVQGGLDLAQMAEPNRRDIGFLGLGGSMPDLEVLTKAVAKGANPTQAAAQIANGNTAKFAQLLTAYSQSIRGR